MSDYYSKVADRAKVDRPTAKKVTTAANMGISQNWILLNLRIDAETYARIIEAATHFGPAVSKPT